MNAPSHIIIHTLGYLGEADIDEVRRWHLERGWSDVGYHYLVRYNGQVQKGRPEDENGAHARGYNSHSIGIALEGHGDMEMWTLPQLLSLLRLCDDLTARHDIPPHAVLGHRETGARKTCPGKLIDMDAFRGILFEYLLEDGNTTNEKSAC